MMAQGERKGEKKNPRAVGTGHFRIGPQGMRPNWERRKKDEGKKKKKVGKNSRIIITVMLSDLIVR